MSPVSAVMSLCLLRNIRLLNPPPVHDTRCTYVNGGTISMGNTVPGCHLVPKPRARLHDVVLDDVARVTTVTSPSKTSTGLAPLAHANSRLTEAANVSQCLHDHARRRPYRLVRRRSITRPRAGSTTGLTERPPWFASMRDARPGAHELDGAAAELLGVALAVLVPQGADGTISMSR